MVKRSAKKRPAKFTNVLNRARQCINQNLYRITEHADQRMAEREVILPEVRCVILNGYHEKAKDAFKPERGGWTYSIRVRR